MKQSSITATRGRAKKNTGDEPRSRSGPAGQKRRNARNGSPGQKNENSNGRKANTSQSSPADSRNQLDDRRAGSGNNGNGRLPVRRHVSGQRGSGSEEFQGKSHLEKFFLDQLQDIYYAEQKITQLLPKMQEAATTEVLKEAFEDHLQQTQRHVKRLEKVFESLGRKAEGKKCEAIEGIAREAEAIISETEEGTLTRDAALIIAAQKVEHYEIATYGGLLQLAITMELHDAADLLDKTLVEEEDTDALLTEIAENEINLRAEHEGNQYSWNTRDSEGEDNMEQDENGKTGEEDKGPGTSAV